MDIPNIRTLLNNSPAQGRLNCFRFTGWLQQVFHFPKKKNNFFVSSLSNSIFKFDQICTYPLVIKHFLQNNSPIQMIFHDSSLSFPASYPEKSPQTWVNLCNKPRKTRSQRSNAARPSRSSPPRATCTAAPARPPGGYAAAVPVPCWTAASPPPAVTHRATSPATPWGTSQ